MAIKAIEYMLYDVIELLNPILEITNSIPDLSNFVNYTDNFIMNFVDFIDVIDCKINDESYASNIDKAAEIFDRIKTRDLYKHINQITHFNY